MVSYAYVSDGGGVDKVVGDGRHRDNGGDGNVRRRN